MRKCTQNRQEWPRMDPESLKKSQKALKNANLLLGISISVVAARGAYLYRALGTAPKPSRLTAGASWYDRGSACSRLAGTKVRRRLGTLGWIHIGPFIVIQFVVIRRSCVTRRKPGEVGELTVTSSNSKMFRSRRTGLKPSKSGELSKRGR